MPNPVREFNVDEAGAYAAVFRIPFHEGIDSIDASVLDGTERERLAAFTRQEDRVRYGFAHVALRMLLSENLGVEAHSLRFGRDNCPCCGQPHGRPTLAGWPNRPIEFSLSHGGHFVMIGIASAPIGVDVERLPSAQTVGELIACMHPNEQALIRCAGDPSDRREFTRLWVRKEAYLKAIGTGLARSSALDDLTCPPVGWSLVEHLVDEDHFAAVAVRGASTVKAEAPPTGRARRWTSTTGCRRPGDVEVGEPNGQA